MRSFTYKGHSVKLVEFSENTHPIEIYVDNEYIEAAFDWEMGEYIAKEYISSL